MKRRDEICCAPHLPCKVARDKGKLIDAGDNHCGCELGRPLPVLEIVFGPPTADFGSIWSSQIAMIAAALIPTLE